MPSMESLWEKEEENLFDQVEVFCILKDISSHANQVENKMTERNQNDENQLSV